MMGPISKRRGERGITHSELITRSKSLIYRSVKEEGAKGAARFMGSTDKKWFARWFVRTLMETETALQAGGRRKFLSGRAAAFCGESFHHFDASEWIRRGVPSSNLDRSVFIPAGSVSGVLLLGGKTPVAPCLPLPLRPGRHICDAEAVVIISYLKRHKREVSYSS